MNAIVVRLQDLPGLESIDTSKMSAAEVANYRTEVETLSGFPVRVSAEATPEGTTGMAQLAWKHGRKYHVIKHIHSTPPNSRNTLLRMS